MYMNTQINLIDIILYLNGKQLFVVKPNRLPKLVIFKFQQIPIQSKLFKINI